MDKITLKQLAAAAGEVRGRIGRIYLHWTAGWYDSTFADYHVNITGDGSIYLSTSDLTEVLAHTWRRNTGAVGVALCCCVDATICADGSFSLGSVPPTCLQIESAAKVIAVLTEALDLPINPECVLTHAEVADIDGYGPAQIAAGSFEKWDLWRLPDYDGTWRSGGDVLRGKALWYRARHAADKIISCFPAGKTGVSDEL